MVQFIVKLAYQFVFWFNQLMGSTLVFVPAENKQDKLGTSVTLPM